MRQRVARRAIFVITRPEDFPVERRLFAMAAVGALLAIVGTALIVHVGVVLMKLAGGEGHFV